MDVSSSRVTLYLTVGVADLRPQVNKLGRDNRHPYL
jgi:hypothetical protein